MEEVFENKLLDDLYQVRGEGIELEYIKKYGKPNQIAEVKENGEVLFFSNIKEGAYTGKMPKFI